MKKLYKFFFLLFCAFCIISVIYGTLMSWLTFQVIIYMNVPEITMGAMPFGDFLRTGLAQAPLYGLVLLLLTIFLFNKSYRNGQRFTIRDIIKVAAAFFAVTTAVYIICYFSFTPTGVFGNLLLVFGPQLFLPVQIWYPFLIAWLILSLVLAGRIKKNE